MYVGTDDNFKIFYIFFVWLQESCKGVVDKYIEYDPVIVMIDLVLMSKEAQRHVIYNTEFKVINKISNNYSKLYRSMNEC